MPRLKLIITLDGKFILVSPEGMDDATSQRIHDTWREAHRTGDLAIIPECEVVILERSDR